MVSSNYFDLVIFICFHTVIAQSAKAVEYTDCASAEG